MDGQRTKYNQEPHGNQGSDTNDTNDKDDIDGAKDMDDGANNWRLSWAIWRNFKLNWSKSLEAERKISERLDKPTLFRSFSYH